MSKANKELIEKLLESGIRIEDIISMLRRFCVNDLIKLQDKIDIEIASRNSLISE